MKERELAKHTTCDVCNRLITASGLPLFWVVTCERHGLDARAMRRQLGLGMVLGSPMLAGIMGPDEDMTRPVMDPIKLTVCEGCMLDKGSLFAHLALDRSAKQEVPEGGH